VRIMISSSSLFFVSVQPVSEDPKQGVVRVKPWGLGTGAPMIEGMTESKAAARERMDEECMIGGVCMWLESESRKWLMLRDALRYGNSLRIYC